MTGGTEITEGPQSPELPQSSECCGTGVCDSGTRGGWTREPGYLPLRFLMRRDEDVTGVSGTGIVAHGVLFSTGRVVVAWVTGVKSVGVYDRLADLYNTSGHSGATWPDWID